VTKLPDLTGVHISDQPATLITSVTNFENLTRKGRTVQ